MPPVGKIRGVWRVLTSDVDLEASPRARAAASIIEKALSAGKLSVADAALFADAFRAAGWKVQIPAPDGQGYLRVVRKACSRQNCRCRADKAARHGPYVYRVSRDRWGKRVEEYLGRVRSPADAPRIVLRKRGKKPQGAVGGDFLVD